MIQCSSLKSKCIERQPMREKKEEQTSLQFIQIYCLNFARKLSTECLFGHLAHALCHRTSIVIVIVKHEGYNNNKRFNIFRTYYCDIRASNFQICKIKPKPMMNFSLIITPTSTETIGSSPTFHSIRRISSWATISLSAQQTHHQNIVLLNLMFNVLSGELLKLKIKIEIYLPKIANYLLFDLRFRFFGHSFWFKFIKHYIVACLVQ